MKSSRIVVWLSLADCRAGTGRLVFTVTLGTTLLAAGIAQLLTSVITIGQFIGFTVPFIILTLVALWLTVVLFRSCSDVATRQPVIVQAAHV